MTKLGFRREGIPYTEITATDEDVKTFKSEGVEGFPVVRVDMGDSSTWTWNGFRHDNIKRLGKLFSESLAAVAA